MAYEQLDDEELLQLALPAMREANDAAGLEVLNALVVRRPDDGRAQYLLGAQYAQLNMADRAEPALRKAVELAPAFPLARLQLGQLLLVTRQLDAAKDTLEPMGDHAPAVQAYAKGLCALAKGRNPRL